MFLDVLIPCHGVYPSEGFELLSQVRSVLGCDALQIVLPRGIGLLCCTNLHGQVVAGLTDIHQTVGEVVDVMCGRLPVDRC